MDLRPIPPASGKTMDNCYLKDFKEGWGALSNPSRQIGFGLAWDPTVFKYLWIWQALGGGLGYPWYGRTNCIAIEPWTSYPCGGLAEAVAKGTSAKLDAGCWVNAWLTASVFTGGAEVTNINRQGEANFSEINP